jgi:putative glutamine amidotransferase
LGAFLFWRTQLCYDEETMHKPIIGITTTTQFVPVPSGQKSVAQVNSAYIRLVTDFGCTPLLLYSEYEPDDVKRVSEFLDGLIIIGGQDIDPALYGEKCEVDYSDAHQGFGSRYQRPLSYKPNRKRDEVELRFYALAKAKKIPILGICRGLQLINVAEGGSLHQEIPEPMRVKHYHDDDGWVNHHPIQIAPKSFAYHALGTDQYFISSVHHQTINRLGSGLIASARAPDGVIEVIERVEGDDFIVGVHGHIEQTRGNLPLFDNLLSAFAQRAKNTIP